MAKIIRMPKLGLNMIEGTIVKWLKDEGDTVSKGEPLVEIEGDKVVFTEEATVSGILKEILASEGDNVRVGEAIAVIGEKNESVEELPELDKNTQEKTNNQSNIEIQKKSTDKNVARRIMATPAARKIANDNNIQLKILEGSGPNNIIVKNDVEDYLHRRNHKSESEDIRSSGDKLIIFNKSRKKIAQNTVQSKQQAPHYYITMEVNMTKAIDLKDQINQTKNFKISINDLIVKATAQALKLFPIINSTVVEEGVLLKEKINIGIVTAVEEGLIVPVLKEADKKSLQEISIKSKEIINQARDKNLNKDNYLSGTFTISNLGMYDVDNFTAVINKGQSAILAISKIKKRPIIENDEIKIYSMMNLTLSSDHRVIDGAKAAAFLSTIKKMLEAPINLLL